MHDDAERPSVCMQQKAVDVIASRATAAIFSYCAAATSVIFPRRVLQLLEKLAGLGRGVKASDADKSEVDRLARQLEARNPNKKVSCCLADSAQLSGFLSKMHPLIIFVDEQAAAYILLQTCRQAVRASYNALSFVLSSCIRCKE